METPHNCQDRLVSGTFATLDRLSYLIGISDHFLTWQTWRDSSAKHVLGRFVRLRLRCESRSLGTVDCEHHRVKNPQVYCLSSHLAISLHLASTLPSFTP